MIWPRLGCQEAEERLLWAFNFRLPLSGTVLGIWFVSLTTSVRTGCTSCGGIYFTLSVRFEDYGDGAS